MAGRFSHWLWQRFHPCLPENSAASGSSCPAWIEAPKIGSDAPNIVVILLYDTAYALVSTFGGPARRPLWTDSDDVAVCRHAPVFLTPCAALPSRNSLGSPATHQNAGYDEPRDKWSMDGAKADQKFSAPICQLPASRRSHGAHQLADGRNNSWDMLLAERP